MHQQSDIYQKGNKVVPKPEEFLQWWERKSEIQAFMEPLAFNHRTLRRGLLVNATVFLFFLTADWTLDDEVCVLSVRSNYTLLKMINCCCSWCCKNDKMFRTCLFNLHLVRIILKKSSTNQQTKWREFETETETKLKFRFSVFRWLSKTRVWVSLFKAIF